MALSNQELLTRFEAEHYERNSISAGRRHQSNVVLRHLADQLGDRTLIEMTPSDLMAWQGAELKRGLAPATVGKEQNMIRAFIGWAYLADLLDWERSTQLKSLGEVRGATSVNLPNPYRKREIEHFREAMQRKYALVPPTGRGSLMMSRFLKGTSRFRGAVRLHARRLQYDAQVSLALEEGLRRIEIHNITVAEMHYDNESVLVRTAKSKPGQRREREVPFTSHSRLCVQEWLNFRALLCPSHESPWLTLRNYDPLSPQSFTHLKNALSVFGSDLAGRPWRWHRFRHTFATERLRSGMPLEQLQIMLGHGRLEQSLAYAQIVSSDIHRETDRTERDFEEAIGVVAR